MIKIKEINKEFATKKEAISHLKTERKNLIKLKKMQTIHTDGISFGSLSPNKGVVKNADSNQITVKVVMNTTNIMDSHSDVHVKGIWNKTIKDNGTFYHLQEHKTTFDAVISDNAKAYVQEMQWKDLGVDYEGKTEALIFESTISKERNPFMFEQYSKGYVKNHSVGMQYVNLELALYDEDDEKEMDFWNKHIKDVLNREDAERQGYFWVVSEAKLKEGSAVLFGSNSVTPTLEVKSEPPQGTHDVRPQIAPDVINQMFNF